MINDKDRSLFAFWHSVLNETDAFCQRIYDCEVTVENWDRQRYVQKTKAEHDLLTLGVSTFFLNRVNRSGIIMAGIIGGRQQAGTWKIDARFNKVELIQRIKRIASYSDRIKLFNDDALQLIKRLEKSLPRKSLIYLDPPYFHKGRELYMNHYQPDDHALIADFLANRSDKNWIVSYDGVDSIRNLYKNFRQVEYTISYSAGKTDKGKELMVYSNAIEIPNEPFQLGRSAA